ncbi:MAG: hypothetical protein GY815_04690 [Gammaproteobacteria bacterium]|nr:hypothetical protein [Gammaproteobacteria bacterium]
MTLGINLILGVGLIIYGMYMLVRRQVAPQDIEKLQALIESHGAKTGRSIHVVGHTVVPLVAGVLLLIAHFRA